MDLTRKQDEKMKTADLGVAISSGLAAELSHQIVECLESIQNLFL